MRAMLALGATAAMLALAGCAGTSRPATAPPTPSGDAVAPITADDACASRLHDLCGALFLHLLESGDLPASLAELGPAPGDEAPPAPDCPVSKKPYVYNPVGIYLPERRARVVVYDPAPSHAGMRWAIIAEEPDELAPPVFKVIALPESMFILRPPR